MASGEYCSDLLVADGKLYALFYKPGVQTRLVSWNTLDLSRKDIPDNSYTILSGVDAGEASLAFDGRNIAVAYSSISRVDLFDTQTAGITPSWIVLGAAERVRGIVTDGRSWFINCVEYFWTDVDPRIIRFYQTPTGMQRDPKQYGPFTGLRGGPVTFDGTFLWASVGGKLMQLSTKLDVIAEFPTDEDFAGPFAFDGAAIWACLPVAGKVARVTRLTSGRQF